MGIGEIFGSVFGWAFNLFPYPNAKKWLAVYTNPHETMNKEMKNQDIGEAAKNIAIAYIPYAILNGLIALVFSLIANGAVGLITGIIGLVVGAILGPIMAVIGTLIGTGIVWVIAKVLGGKGSYGSQYNLTSLIGAGGVVISTVLLIPMSIPFIGLLFALITIPISLYELYLTMKSVRMVHGVSRIVAAIAVLLPIVVILVLLFVVFAAVLATMGLGALATGAAGSAYGGDYY